MRRKYSSNLAFIDMLFNVLVGFVFLFIIAFLMINPITKKNDIPSKAEIMIILQWDDLSVDDIDVWVKPQDDSNLPVSFKVKDVGLWHLDRDDLGTSNDTIKVDGQTTVLSVNREVVTMRGIQKGDVLLNVHIYSKRDSKPTPFTVTVIDINPYREVIVYKGMSEEVNQIFVLPGFTVDSDGFITDVFENDVIFAAKRSPHDNVTYGLGDYRSREATP